VLADNREKRLMNQDRSGHPSMEPKSPTYPPDVSQPGTVPDTTDVADSKPEWLRNQEAAAAVIARCNAERATKEVVVNTGQGNPRWTPGMKSPNPAGRPPSIAQRKAKVHERMLDQAGAVIDVMLQKALEGDSAAAALVVNRVLPSLRPQSEKVHFTLDVDQPISKQVEQVLSAIAKGDVAPDVGKKITEVVQALGNIRTIEDLEQRITMLEAKQI